MAFSLHKGRDCRARIGGNRQLALRKGQADIFNFSNDVLGEAHIVERAFGIGPCALAEAVTMLENHLQQAKA